MFLFMFCQNCVFIPKRRKRVALILTGVLFLIAYYICKRVFESEYESTNPIFHYTGIPCPAVVKFYSGSGRVNNFNKSNSVDCTTLFERNTEAVNRALTFQRCRRKSLEYHDYTSIANDCANFRQLFDYDKRSVSEEELALPIAFSIIFHENVEQAERLLRAIWRPHNFYCLHLDARTSKEIHSAVNAISKCLPNVVLPDHKVFIRWAEFTVLQAEIECIRVLLRTSATWKYFINLTGREFPLKTNEEIVKILKIYNGSNDIDGTPHKRPIQWTEYVWRNEKWRTNRRKSPVPHDFLLVKGSSHIVASRTFVEYATSDSRALDLMAWMKDIRVPDEHYFQTLNHNPQHGVPGSYAGDPDLKWSYTRLKLWWTKETNCSGLWIRFICNIGSGELWQLPEQPQLFFNKILLEYDPVAFDCLESWYYWRTTQSSNLNVSFYRNLPFVPH